MRTASLSLAIFLVMLPWKNILSDASATFPDDPKEKPAPKRPTFTIGKDTTFVDGPIDKEGRIGYASALNKKLSEGVTPQNNAVVTLWQAHGPRPEGGQGMPAEFYVWLGIEAPPEKGDYFVNVNMYCKEELQFDAKKLGQPFWDEFDRAGEKPWTPKEYPHFAAWLKANEKPLARVVEGSKRPRYFSPLVPGTINGKPGGIIAALLPGVQKNRAFAQALTMRAMLKIGQGDADGAWQDLLAVHRLGRLVARGGTLIEGLVGVALEAIACKADLVYLDRAKPSARQIDVCLADLKKLPAMPLMADKVDLGERFMYLDVIMMLDQSGVQFLNLVGGLAGGQQPGLSGWIDVLVGEVNWDPAMRTGNKFFDRMAAAMRAKDPPTRQKELAKVEVDVKALKVKSGEWTNAFLVLARGKDGAQAKGKVIGDILVSLLVPAVNKVQNAGDRIAQVDANLQLAFILAKYHRDNARYPEKLEALAPKYLEKVPMDSFSGKELIYRITDTGYFFYSIGVNLKDDGGRTYGDNPPGGDDLGVRMPPR